MTTKSEKETKEKKERKPYKATGAKKVGRTRVGGPKVRRAVFFERRVVEAAELVLSEGKSEFTTLSALANNLVKNWLRREQRNALKEHEGVGQQVSTD